MEGGRKGGGIPPPTAAVKFCWLNYGGRTVKEGERWVEGERGKEGVRRSEVNW